MKEEDIRKRDAFNKYLELVEADVKNFFDFKSFVEIKCPACADGNCVFQFEKQGFRYVSCNKCFTLYVNPRPPVETVREFYSKSPSSTFWINEFFKPVMDVRREKIFKPRAEYVSKMCGKGSGLIIGDIGAGYGLFLNELREILPENYYVAIEPSVEMSDICNKSGLEVKCMFLEDVNEISERGGGDLLTAFELLEHLVDPVYFIKKVNCLLKPGGLFFLTTLNAKGFDILMLWDRSKSIFPPHHLNFFNPSSIKYLFERLGFEIVEISTPGKLDWSIVEGMIKNEGVDLGRFWSLLSKESDEKCKKGLQDWISRNNLSSHMSLLAKKS